MMTTIKKEMKFRGNKNLYELEIYISNHVKVKEVEMKDDRDGVDRVVF